MSQSLAITTGTLPATRAEAIDLIRKAEDRLAELPQIDLKTEHVIHGGMYVRTIRLQPGVVITGALIKIPTMLIVNGVADVFVGDGWAHLEGYNVIPASAGRKQIFVARSEVAITMIFPTGSQSIEQCEQEFTDEWERLQTARNGHATDLINITGE